MAARASPTIEAPRHSSFVIRHSSFVIRHSSFVIRHSSFVIRHSSFVIRHSAPAPRARLVLGPVSRIMFHALRHFDCHFSQQPKLLSRKRGMRHTRDYRTGRPVAYFALHPSGFFVPPFSRTTRWALTPPFHPYRSGISDLKFEISNPDRRFVFCDTVRRVALKRRSRTWGYPRAASCPAVSGLSSPRTGHRRPCNRPAGIKERGATIRPQNQNRIHPRWRREDKPHRRRPRRQAARDGPAAPRPGQY